jgi:hypothetical protein
MAGRDRCHMRDELRETKKMSVRRLKRKSRRIERSLSDQKREGVFKRKMEEYSAQQGTGEKSCENDS